MLFSNKVKLTETIKYVIDTTTRLFNESCKYGISIVGRFRKVWLHRTSCTRRPENNYIQADSNFRSLNLPSCH